MLKKNSDSSISDKDPEFNELLGKVEEPLDNQTIIEKIKKLDGYDFSGVIKNTGTLEDIKNQAKFINPSAAFGFVFAKNSASIWDIRQKIGTDLYITDNYGILKNGYSNTDTKTLVDEVKSKKGKVFYFLGGSTAISTGCRLPEYTIPALVEKILHLKYNIKAVCINLGFPGISNMYYKDILDTSVEKFGKPTGIIAYGGWNECYHYTEAEAHKIVDKNNKYPRTLDRIFAHSMHHDFILKNIYNSRWLFFQTIKVFLSELNLIIIKTIRLNFFRKFMNYLFDKLIHTRLAFIHDKNLEKKLKIFFSNDENVKNTSEAATHKYYNNEILLNQFCKENIIEYFSFFQPTVFYGKKKLTKDEILYKKINFADTDLIKNNHLKFENFYKTACQINKDFTIYDLTSTFDDITKQIYIDVGHINRLGNFMISLKVAEIISKKN